MTADAPADVRRPHRWRRRFGVLAVLLAVVVVVLTRLDTQVRTPVGAKGVGAGSFPVVELAGLGSNGEGFAKLTAALSKEGVTVLDFDPDAPGVQPLVYRPKQGEEIATLAKSFAEPQIRAALTRAGLDPDTQQVDVVAHSMGGLVMRYLIEKDGWADRVDDLVMVGTPNHGSAVVGWETSIGSSPMGGLGTDMTPGSSFLASLGYAEPAGEVYTTVGGDPWVFRWLRYGKHGFDDQVPAESPFLTGAANNTYAHLHGRLLRSDDVVSLITRTLRAT